MQKTGVLYRQSDKHGGKKMEEKGLFRFNLRSLGEEEKYYEIFLKEKFFGGNYFEKAKDVEGLRAALLAKNPKDSRKINAFFNSLNKLKTGDYLWIRSGENYAVGQVKSAPKLSKENHDKYGVYVCVDADFKEVEEMGNEKISGSFTGGTAISKINDEEALSYSEKAYKKAPAKKAPVKKSAPKEKPEGVKFFEAIKEGEEKNSGIKEAMFNELSNYYMLQFKLMMDMQQKVVKTFIQQNIMLTDFFLKTVQVSKDK